MQRPDSICPLQQNARDQPPTWSRLLLTRAKPERNANMHPLHASIAEWIGAECPVDFLNVWFRLIGHP